MIVLIDFGEEIHHVSREESFKTEWANRSLTIETGQLAKQANGAVLVRYGETVVLSTAVASKEPRDTDFFPLMVNFEEKMYAAGKIPGGFKNVKDVLVTKQL